jgi:hypothetical protein
MAWLHKDALIEALMHKFPSTAGQLTLNERSQRAAELEREIERLERLEEATIEQAQQAGVDVPRRPKANPLCVLNLRLTSAAQAA